MPALSSFLPLSGLAVLRRAPFWAQALALCALLVIVGIAVLDDYGVGFDEPTHREMAIANADYIATGATDLLYHRDYRYYGVAFDLSLLSLERALGLQDSRHIYLTRHLIMHMFFIVGGFACGMLAYRTLGNRWVALLAMLMFLLHPRLYAHSFFNVKDVPFAAMLIIALYLTHRAFRRDTLGAFLLCGIVVGLAINMRPFALMLLPMILAMRGLDMRQAGRAERKRILASAGIFAAAALAITYIIHSYYWESPLRFIELTRVMAQHPTITRNLFMGEIYTSDAVPWNYIPVWFAITAPPVALALGALGAAAVCWQGIARPIVALRNREIRFRIMSLGCIALPVAAVIVMQSNTHQDWRQMYFLWGPFCLLAAVGLHWLANSGARVGWNVGARLPGRVLGGGIRRAFAYGAAGFGLITTLTAMAALHPHQQVYFNALADTKTPGAIGGRYDMDYWQVARRQLMEYMLARYPDGALRVWPENKSLQILPQNDRERILVSGNINLADYYVDSVYSLQNAPDEPAFHSIEAYGSVIAFILAPNSDAYRNYYRAEYDDVEANGTLLARSDFDVYIHNGELRYLKADCAPPTANADFGIFLHFFPVNLVDLPADRREFGFENRDVNHAAFFDGKCIGKQGLPDYPVARIRTGQDAAASGGDGWRVDIDLAAYAGAQALYESIVAGDYGQPVARSDFDVYLRGNGLAYLKEHCAEGDVDARFFLHIFPADTADLPADGDDAGFVNLDFQFADYGTYAGDRCVAERELPDYAIERIRTGQFVSGEGQLWGVEFAAGR